METTLADAAQLVAEQVVRIQTQKGSGTGTLVYGRTGGTRLIATAKHVVDGAHALKRPITIWRGPVAVPIGPGGMAAVYVNAKVKKSNREPDCSLIALIAPGLLVPRVPMLATAERQHVTLGTEVGWLGYPGLRSVAGRLCFFSGRISAVDPDTNRYLIDGTGVHGCSGGPIFCLTPSGPRIIGVVSEYLPNCVEDENARIQHWPGLTSIEDLSIYSGVQEALEKLPKKEVSVTIKLDQCPRCGGQLAKGRYPDGTPTLFCAQTCGPLLELLDRDLVNRYGPQVNKAIYEAYEQVMEADDASASRVDPVPGDRNDLAGESK